jgi:hypothetical protein
MLGKSKSWRGKMAGSPRLTIRQANRVHQVRIEVERKRVLGENLDLGRWAGSALLHWPNG